MSAERDIHRLFHDVLVNGNINSPHWITGAVAFREFMAGSRFAVSPLDVIGVVKHWADDDAVATYTVAWQAAVTKAKAANAAEALKVNADAIQASEAATVAKARAAALPDDEALAAAAKAATEAYELAARTARNYRPKMEPEYLPPSWKGFDVSATLEQTMTELRATCDTPSVADYGVELFSTISEATLLNLADGKAPRAYYDALLFLRYVFSGRLATPVDVDSAKLVFTQTCLALDALFVSSGGTPYHYVDKTAGKPAAERYTVTPDALRKWLVWAVGNSHLHEALRVDVSLRLLLRAPARYSAYIASLYA